MDGNELDQEANAATPTSNLGEALNTTPDTASRLGSNPYLEGEIVRRESSRLSKIVSRIRARGGSGGLERGHLESNEQARQLNTSMFDELATSLDQQEGDDAINKSDFLKAKEIVLTHAKEGFKELLKPEPKLPRNSINGLEAIVRADGSRPSIPILKNTASPDHPFALPWKNNIIANTDSISELACCVGRIELQQGGGPDSYFGTGTLIDDANGIILTNYHVLIDALSNPRVVSKQVDGRIENISGLCIDFDGELGSSLRNRFSISEAYVPTNYGEGFDGIDAAILVLGHSIDNGNKPTRRFKVSRNARYEAGMLGSIMTIGFPGVPPRETGYDGGIDWQWVNKVLFGDQYGIKRFAPGRRLVLKRPHSLDRQELSIGHDATTFGGASGSLLCAWADAQGPCFALHFYGDTNESNYALSLSRIANQLAEIGVKFDG